MAHVRSIPLYKERYVFVTGDVARHAGRESIAWHEAALERLCLLSEEMQNRRIIDAILKSLGLKVRPAIVSNSFLAVCSHLRQGGFASIVPHGFFYVFVKSHGLVAIDLVEPAHSQMIGLVLSDRDPLPPMAAAISATARDAIFAKGIAAAASTGF